MSDADGYPETWLEAAAAFARARPAEVVRGPRHVTVNYRAEGRGFAATSPEISGFRAFGRTLDEARDAARMHLELFLDPEVKVTERPSPEEVAAADGLTALTEELGLYGDG